VTSTERDDANKTRSIDHSLPPVIRYRDPADVRTIRLQS
jgi:hypothetical protein